jgi:hypothetical protein
MKCKIYLLIGCFIFIGSYLNAQTNKQERETADFESFLPYFLNATFWNKNIDSLVYKGSPLITEFTTKELPFKRYWNPGTMCFIFSSDDYGYTVYDNKVGVVQPKNKNFKLNKEKKPIDGFCEESKNKDGVYYNSISNFPDFQDPNKGDNPNCKMELPQKYGSCKKMEVNILFKKFIIKKMYFIQINKIWYLLFFDDCDCSA